MATEAQNIMQAFYSANKREEVKEEEREFKKGALGYMGGVPGALFRNKFERISRKKSF